MLLPFLAFLNNPIEHKSILSIDLGYETQPKFDMIQFTNSYLDDDQGGQDSNPSSNHSMAHDRVESVVKFVIKHKGKIILDWY